MPHIVLPPPLISARMSFILQPPPAPEITFRMEFDDIFEAAAIHPAPERVRFRDGTDDNPGRTIETNPDTLSASGSRKPKPAGEPGRPGSGGYALDQTLLDVEKWARETYDDILTAVHKEADGVLDKSISFRAQNQEKVDQICFKMTTRWKFLSNYENCWPVRDMLKLHLKYTSEACRRAKSKAAGQRLERMMRECSPNS